MQVGSRRLGHQIRFLRGQAVGVARVRSVIIEGRRDELCTFLGAGE